MREVIDNQAHEMIADGLVCHSKSPYSAPILLNRKKCGGWRFLTDFRKINDACNKVVFPLPRIEDSIHRLEKPKFFSSMDLTKGFWQIPVHPDDRKFLVFGLLNPRTMEWEYYYHEVLCFGAVGGALSPLPVQVERGAIRSTCRCSLWCMA